MGVEILDGEAGDPKGDRHIAERLIEEAFAPGPQNAHLGATALPELVYLDPHLLDMQPGLPKNMYIAPITFLGRFLPPGIIAPPEVN
jgi:hypothetical protein